MKKKQIVIIRYEAFDGKCFDTEEECFAYEAEHKPGYTIMAYNLVDHDWRETPRFIDPHAVVLPDEKAKEQFKAVYKLTKPEAKFLSCIADPGVYVNTAMLNFGITYCDFAELNALRRKLKRLADAVYKPFGQMK